MIELVRKDMPLRGNITTFECKLNDPKMDRELIKTIDEYGDRQNHSSNVKAQMTEWKMWHEPSFKTIADISLNIANQLSPRLYNRSVDLQLQTLWGMKYKSGESAIAHDHWPALWSFVYYINAPKNASGLFFPEMGEQGGERKLEKGLMIFFQGHIKHSVRPSKFRGSRYCVSGNMREKI
tara:strand:+ start:350 stop:889 length:540 start_codon:yes stop_codon:yes gene_type:complete